MTSIIQNDKQAYRELAREWALPLFHEPWWLDISTGGKWKCQLMKTPDFDIFLPHFTSERACFQIVSNPFATPYLGHFIQTKSAAGTKVARSKVINALTTLYKRICETNIYIKMHPLAMSADAFGPFKINRSHTYVLNLKQSEIALLESFASRTRNDIRHARSKLSIVKSQQMSSLNVVKKSVERAGKKLLISDSKYRQLALESRQRGVGNEYFAIDSQKKIHAAAWTVWDSYGAYNLYRGREDESRRGATTLLIWEMLKDLIGEAPYFDFVGSDIPSIENYIKGFTPIRKEVHILYRENYFLHLLRSLRKVIP